MLARLLLRAGLRALDLGQAADLRGWTRDAYGRPSLLDCPADFSISHAAGAVVCAISLEDRVGLDIEPYAALPPRDLRAVMGEEEWADIMEAKVPTLRGLQIWTSKEAALKADGRGLSLDPREVDARTELVLVRGATWRVLRPELGEEWVCSLAAKRAPASLNLVSTSIEALLQELPPL